MSSVEVAPVALFDAWGEGGRAKAAIGEGGAAARASEEPGAEAAADVVTSAPTLEAMLGRRWREDFEGGEVCTRRVVAFGSLPALAGETLEACVERYRTTE